MRKSKFTESQILAVLKEGEAGVPIAELTRKHGIRAARRTATGGRRTRTWYMALNRDEKSIVVDLDVSSAVRKRGNSVTSARERHRGW